MWLHHGLLQTCREKESRRYSVWEWQRGRPCVILQLLTKLSPPDKSPKPYLKKLYGSIPGFRAHPEPSLIPVPVEKYGLEHMAFWQNSTGEIPSRPMDSPGMYYKGGIISHRYSADISRALHVDEWKNEIAKPKHAALREVTSPITDLRENFHWPLPARGHAGCGTQKLFRMIVAI